MGVWGTAIFSDDTANDVRDEYKNLIGDGLSTSDATDRILSRWKTTIDDPDDQSVFWLALAITQWNLGRLEDRVKEKAIEAIDSGHDLDRWEGREKAKRQNVLDKTRKLIQSPQPPVKRIPKRFKDHCEWKKGELIAYTTVSKEKVLFRVIGFHEDNGGRAPVCELLNWKGTRIPHKLKLRFLGIKRKENPNRMLDLTQFMIGRIREKELPIDRVERIGVSLKPSQDAGGHIVFSWRNLDRCLAEYFGIE
jgi:hypothetical protein